MKKTIFYLFLAISSVALYSCNEDSNPNQIPDNTLADIVTLYQTQESSTVFQLQEKDDEPIATLTANDFTISNTPFKTGDRVMISYVPKNGERYVSDYITLYAISSVYNPEIIVEEINKYPDWDFAPIKVDKLWRTSSFINLYSRITYYQETNFRVIIDKYTINNSYPDVYLTYDLDANINSQEKTFITSFDISSVWNLTTCQGVNIYLKNDDKVQTITINKNLTIKPVE